jgi:hypothetical protein
MSCDRKLSPFAIAVLVVSALGANVALAEPEQGFPNDSRYSWNNVTIVAGGFITGIVPNTAFKDVMYVRTDIGGAYRYDPFSNKWTPLNDIFSATDWNLMGTESIAVDPVQPWRVYSKRERKHTVDELSPRSASPRHGGLERRPGQD